MNGENEGLPCMSVGLSEIVLIKTNNRSKNCYIRLSSKKFTCRKKETIANI